MTVFCLVATATTEIDALSLHDALPICRRLYGIDDFTRQQRREAVLSCTPGEVCRAAEILGEYKREAVSSVMAGALFLEDLGRLDSNFTKYTVTVPV